MRAWSFSDVCRQVAIEHPEWSLKHVELAVESENAQRILVQHPKASHFTIVDNTPNLPEAVIAELRVSHDSMFKSDGLLLVLPFCSREVSLLLKLIHWMKELDPESNTDVLISYDLGTNLRQVKMVKDAIMGAFANWSELCYPVPPKHYFAPNWAFQCAARFISGSTTRPWLWFEADMTPLKPGWRAGLQAAYISSKRPCMGVLVPGMGHMNGTAIYPHDYAKWAHSAMTCTNGAWDMAQTRDITGSVHEASYIMQHAWGVVGGKLHPSQGQAPSFPTEKEMERINPKALTFHRCKDGTLIDRLRERKA